MVPFLGDMFILKGCNYCWWFRNLSNQLIARLSQHDLQGLLHLRISIILSEGHNFLHLDPSTWKFSKFSMRQGRSTPYVRDTLFNRESLQWVYKPLLLTGWPSPGNNESLDPGM